MTYIVSEQRWRQVAWLLLALWGAVLWLAGPASQSLRIRSICRPLSCSSYQLGAPAASTLSGHGISLTAYAVFTVLVLGFLSVVWYGLAGLIILREPDNRGAVMAAFFLVAFPLLEVATWIPSAPSWLKTLLPATGVAVLLLFCLLFPDGTFAPAWALWLAPLAMAGVLSAFLPLAPRAAVLAAALAAVVAAQVARFRTVSSWAQRQQAKWALYGVLAAAVAFAALAVGFLLLPAAQTGTGGIYRSFANSTGLALAASPIPISTGIAILRYHLWDIDRVVSLTLGYAILTAVLAGLYVAGVILLEQLVQLFTTNGSDAAIALSTLTVVAVFGPLRRRIQTGIDRYFHRAKYDAARTLAAFGERLRREVDLDALSRDLTSVVEETLNPERVSLWVRTEVK